MDLTAQQKSVELQIAGRVLRLSTGLLAQQAQGAVVAALGDTQILATGMMSSSPRDGVDFFPLSVDYEERYYASGKIKGSRFIKREGRPSENAILTARLIDRPIRPLFPEGTTNDVQVIATALSVDLEVDPGTTAIIAASAALMISGMPFSGPIGAVRMGYVENAEGKWELIVNPTYQQVEKGKLNLVVAGTMNAITMVEAAAKEVTEEVMLEALQIAHENIKKICTLQLDLAKMFSPKPIEAIVGKKNEEAVKAVTSFITKEMLDGLNGKTKKEVKEKASKVEEELLKKYEKEMEEGLFSKGELKMVLSGMRENHMREKILNSGERNDGRGLDEIRPISTMVGLIPRTHGSGLFQRGETQVLSLTTLGAPGDSQIVDNMDSDYEKRYMHHYNFPPYSVGEIKPMRGTSRREIGHGDLAERALIPVLPVKADFPYTIRVVSEVMTCNGSSSMGSICGSTLSLMNAGVPLIRPVAGIAMGLITSADFDGTKGAYKILTDIQGLEDAAGDMDFKVAGSSEGITALQMDIKVTGLSVELMKEALEKAKKARLFILDEMKKTIAEPSKTLSPYAPLITTIQIQPEQIREVIGKGGEVIQKITAETDCQIDIEQDGLVMVTAPNQEKGQLAIDWINRITYVPKSGDEFDGTVTRIMDFGAFVEFAPGKEGLVHISQLEHHRVNRVEDVVKLGDKVRVKLLEIDDQGRYNLSRKATMPMPAGGVPQSDHDQGGGHGGGFGGNRGGNRPPPPRPKNRF